MSPALAGRFLTTAPPGKPLHCTLKPHIIQAQEEVRVLLAEKTAWAKARRYERAWHIQRTGNTTAKGASQEPNSWDLSNGFSPSSILMLKAAFPLPLNNTLQGSDMHSCLPAHSINPERHYSDTIYTAVSGENLLLPLFRLRLLPRRTPFPLFCSHHQKRSPGGALSLSSAIVGHTHFPT